MLSTPDFIRAVKLVKFFRSGSGNMWDMRELDAKVEKSLQMP